MNGRSVMFEFYQLGYMLNIFPDEEIKEVTDLKILTPEEFEEITGKEYVE